MTASAIAIVRKVSEVQGCDLELVLRVSLGADPDQMEASFRAEFEAFLRSARALLGKDTP